MHEQDQITLQMIRAAVADLSEEDRQRVQRAAAVLRELVAGAGDHGLLALALVGAECEIARI